MPEILRTKSNNPARNFAGIGRLPANGVGGILLSRAAERIDELQDDDGKPLEGAALTKAAKGLAKRRHLDVAEVSDDKVAKLPELAGGTADRPPAGEVAEQLGKEVETARKQYEKANPIATSLDEDPAAGGATSTAETSGSGPGSTDGS